MDVECIFYTGQTGDLMYVSSNSVIILALNTQKSGQIANKGFMIYYCRYMSQLAVLKSLKQNSSSNLLN